MPQQMDEQAFRPKGTWAFMLAFLVVLVVMWFSVYLLLLSRGTTAI